MVRPLYYLLVFQMCLTVLATLIRGLIRSRLCEVVVWRCSEEIRYELLDLPICKAAAEFVDFDRFEYL